MFRIVSALALLTYFTTPVFAQDSLVTLVGKKCVGSYTIDGTKGGRGGAISFEFSGDSDESLTVHIRIEATREALANPPQRELVTDVGEAKVTRKKNELTFSTDARRSEFEYIPSIERLKGFTWVSGSRTSTYAGCSLKK